MKYLLLVALLLASPAFAANESWNECTSGSCPVASFTVSRGQSDTCAAPCCVNAQSTSTDPDAVNEFHSMQYAWDWGDGDGETYPVSGDSRRYGFGPSDGHCYETPGTYTVELRIKSVDGDSDATPATASIEVDDPNSISTYSAIKCVACGSTPVAGVGGCPADATAVQNSCDFDASVLTTNGSATFYLAGFDYDIGTSVTFGNTTAVGNYVASYGTGRATITESFADSGAATMVQAGNRTVFAHINTSGDNPFMGVRQDVGAVDDYLQLYDITLDGNMLVGFQGTVGASAFAHGTALAKIRTSGGEATYPTSAPENWILGEFVDALFLDIDTSGWTGDMPGSGLSRWNHADGVTFKHNRWQMSPGVVKGTNPLMRFRACNWDGTGAYTPCDDMTTPFQKVYWSRNRFVECCDPSYMMRWTTDTQAGGSSPADVSGNQHQDQLFEYNLFQINEECDGTGCDPGNVTRNADYMLMNPQGVQRLTIRRNVFDFSGFDSNSTANLIYGLGGDEPDAVEGPIWVYLNTIYLSQARTGTLRLCNLTADYGSANICAWNLFHAPAMTDGSKVKTFGAATFNSGISPVRNVVEKGTPGVGAEEYSGSPFVALPSHMAATLANMAASGYYEMAIGGTVTGANALDPVDAGTHFSSPTAADEFSGMDIFLGGAPVNSSWDVGASEYGAAAVTPYNVGSMIFGSGSFGSGKW